MTDRTLADVARPELGGKYLTFALGDEGYGLEILKVREIIKFMDITQVPRTLPHVRGVINLRGQVISVIDLRSKFSMPEVESSDETCIIVVEHADPTTPEDNTPKTTTGVIVDRVSEVLTIDSDQIEPAPAMGGCVETQFILGMGKVAQQVKILLDIDRVLGDDAMLRAA
jgi:purine-binding chemotaxis protein CheW